MQRQTRFVLLLLVVILLVACGGAANTPISSDTSPPSNTSNTESSNADAVSSNDAVSPETEASDASDPDSENPETDSATGGVIGNTFDYNGVLVSQSNLGELSLWTLNDGATLPGLKLDPDAEQMVLYQTGTLSHDGNTFAYVKNLPLQLYQTLIRDVASGTETAIPSKAGDQTRFSTMPVPSDAGTVVFVQEMMTINPENAFDVQSGNSDIALWDGSDIHLLTDDDADDMMPTISNDGQTVVFISRRDREDGDFYRIDLTGDTAPTRISIENDPVIASIKQDLPVWYRLSADGTRLFFFANLTDGGIAPYLLDTTSSVLTRLAMPDGLTPLAMDMSGDGSTVAFGGILTNAADPLTSPFYIVKESAPETLTTLGDTGMHGSLALNPDGSAVAVVVTDFQDSNAPYKLVLMNTDGSNPHIFLTDANIVAQIGRLFWRNL